MPRLKMVWGYFLPAWLVPVYFLCARLIVPCLGPKLAVAGFILLFCTQPIALKAKRRFTWSEFYIFWACIPTAILFSGFYCVCFIARLACR